jgi:glucose-1-phosphate cytidylyltransferase
MDIQSNGEVLNFTEKPQSKEWASAGFFVLERPVLEYISGDDCIFEREALETPLTANSWLTVTMASSTPWTHSVNIRP